MQKARLLALPVVLAFSLFIVGCTQNNQSQQTTPEADTNTVTWCVVNPVPGDCFDPIEFTEGQSAYDTLVALDEREDSFSFESVDYGPGVGQFVNKVNDIESSNEYFWKLVYNDEDAQVGVSSIVAKDGDTYSLVYEAIQ